MGLSLDDEEQAAFLARGHTGILTTLRRDGWPVSLPVWYLWHEGHVHIASPPGTAKMRRVRNDDRAWFLVESGERWVDLSAVGFPAHVTVLEPGAEADRIHSLLAEKYADHQAPFDRLPDAAQAHYADRLVLRLDPAGPAISWDNARMRLR
jgi:nitroimidazol reductase NimA-like FMN-containing flavoprotein (pyridoxamine 5'-phosphate oxidase superfamily)